MKLLLILLLTFALQPPPPSPSEITKPPQKKSASTQQPSKDDQRGTKDSPLIVQLLPTPKTQEETARDTKEREDKAANDRRLGDLTQDLVFVTGVLAFISVLQLGVFSYQAWKLRETVKATTAQSTAYINGERAWIIPSIEWAHEVSRVVRIDSNGVEKTGVGMTLICTNQGKTPGWITKRTIGLCIFELPSNGRNPVEVRGEETAFSEIECLGVGDKSTVKADLVCEGRRGSDKNLIILGTLNYTDIFGVERPVDFGYAIDDKNRIVPYTSTPHQ